MKYEQKVSTGLKYVLDSLSPASAYGRELLRNIRIYKRDEMPALFRELENLKVFADMVGQNKINIDKITHGLSGIKDISGSFSRLRRGQTLDEVELFEIRAFLASASGIKSDFEMIFSDAGISGIEIKSFPEAEEILDTGSPGGFFVSEIFSDTLADIRKKKNAAAKKMSLSKTSGERESFRLQHLEFAAAEDAEEAAVRARLSAALAPYADALEKNAEMLGRIDLLIEKARLAASAGCVMPRFGDTLYFKEMYNPGIKNKLEEQGRKFMPLTLECGSGVTVITGANMGGKTIALKSLALNAFLALAGFFVFAQEAVLPVYDFIEIVSENLQQTGKGLSSFAGEIVKLNELYELAGKQQGLILFDEFASGTNAEEGGDIFRAAVRAFSKKNSCMVMTTHLDGVAAEANEHYQVVGLRNLPHNLIAEAGGSSARGIELIAKYMDYGLVKIDKNAEVPKDALNISVMLGLNAEILDCSDAYRSIAGKKRR